MATEGTEKKCAADLGVGWKISPFHRHSGGECAEIARIEGEGAVQHIWMTPTGTWRNTILRIYWDGEESPSVECPVGRFFCKRPAGGEFAQINSPGRVRQSRQRLQLLLGNALPQGAAA